jgi:Domain of unknown function (DUF4340)
MRPRTLLILLALVLGLGAFIWFYERELPSSEERAANAKKVLALEKEDVEKVTIQAPSGRVVLERVGEVKDEKDKKDDKDEEGTEELGQPAAEWRIVQPLQAHADAFAVDGMLDSLAGLEKSRTIEGADPKATGLDKPRATVRLATKDGEKVLKLGAAVPTGGELIAALEGSKDAYVVSDTVFSQIDKEPGSWRDKQLFRAGRDAVSRITLTSGGQRVVLVQDKDRFQIEAPFRDRADRDRVDDLYADLSGLAAESFVDAPRPPAELGLAPPRAVVEVAFKKGAPVRIELGGPAESAAPEPPADPESPPPAGLLYARMGSQVFETRTRLADTAARPPAEWRAHGMTAFEVHEIESATVKDGQGTLRLTRAGTDWKRGDQTISYVSVSDLLFAVTDAKADRLLTSQEAAGMGAALARPAVTIDLDAKAAGKETITLYPPVAAGTPARVSGRDVILLLPGDKLNEVQGRIADVRKAQPLKEEGKKE